MHCTGVQSTCTISVKLALMMRKAFGESCLQFSLPFSDGRTHNMTTAEVDVCSGLVWLFVGKYSSSAVRFDVERKNLWTLIKPCVGGNAGKLSFFSNFKVTKAQAIIATGVRSIFPLCSTTNMARKQILVRPMGLPYPAHRACYNSME